MPEFKKSTVTIEQLRKRYDAAPHAENLYALAEALELAGHGKEAEESFDAFEKKSLSRIGMPDEIVMRHRPPHFGHVFSGGGYAAAYYSYMWSEVLDADAFAAFEESGDIFDAATAKRLHDAIYAAGGRQDPAEAYKAFRGRLPSADALLRKRGFTEPAPNLLLPRKRGRVGRGHGRPA